VVAALDGLARDGNIPKHVVGAAIEHYEINPETLEPRVR